MAQGPQQFTPSQILEAGRRAEAEGRIEYAIQFYRHLTDHLARTGEAAAAREALSRLGASPGPAHSSISQPSTGPTAPAGSFNGSYYNGAATSSVNAAGTQPTSYGPSPIANGSVQSRPQSVQGNAPGAVASRPHAGTEIAVRRTFVLPKSRRRYRTGRFVARACTFLGFVQVGLGLVLVTFGLLARFGIGASLLPEFIAAQQQLIGTAAGISVIVLGMLLVLGGQLARAIFDTASANRDLAAFARARAAFDAGHGDDNSATA